MKIYCDEAGFTGDHMTNADQPYFVYSSVNIAEKDQVQAFLADLKKKYRIQLPEIKASKLLRSSPGRHALTAIWERFGQQSKSVISEKKYVLACKFFEYVFEPSLAAHNSYFYQRKFHFFVANLVHSAFLNKTEGGENLLFTFEKVVRGTNADELFHLLSSAPHDEADLKALAKFTIDNREAFLGEIAHSKGIPTWILDQTLTSLYGLLCHWADQYRKSLILICDESKPLLHSQRIINGFQNQDLRPKYVQLWKTQIPISFRLRKPLQFSDSKSTPALQIADALAGSLAYAHRFPEDSFSRKILPMAYRHIVHERCILPDPVHAAHVANDLHFHQFTLRKLAELRAKQSEVLDPLLRALVEQGFA